MNAEPGRFARNDGATLWVQAVALAVFALALWAQTGAMVGVFYDDGVYLTAAKALAQGAGYRNIHLPGAPPVVHYPVLYPALLSLLWRIWPSFPANVALFQVADAAALGLAAGLMMRQARRIPLPTPAAALALLAGFSAFPLLTLVGTRLSEPLFLALLAGALYLADRGEGRIPPALAAGLLAGLATLARSVGLCAVLGIPLALWTKRHTAAAAAALGAGIVMVVPWVVWAGLNSGQADPRLANYSSYLAEAGQAGLAPMLAGLKLRAAWPLPSLLLPRLPAPLWYPLAIVVLALLTWGAVSLAPVVPALVATLAAYLLLVSVWPFAPDRFVWIVLPWLALLLAAGGVAAWRHGKSGRALVAVAVVAVAIGYPAREARSLAERRFASAAEGISRSFRVLTRSIAAETPADAVIASEDEALIYLYTGRRAVPSHLFRWAGLGTAPLGDDETIRFWCEARVTHLAVTSSGDPAAGMAVRMRARFDASLTPLFQVPDGPALYRFQCRH